MSIMKQKSTKQPAIVGVLGMFVTAAVFALVLTYFGYLPTITSVPVRPEDVSVTQQFYQIARNGFLISGVCGVVLGFAVPVIFKMFRTRYGKHDVF
ncbi:MAG TPA: hypothetical protein VGI03_02610 [Verrucomicrobiae bacterium]|jgi:protein-S-isoprenylcysteine O-methyltransferase Ste14